MTPPTSCVFITRLPRGALCRPALATMTRRALFFALFVLSTLVGGAVARIQDEPVEKDGRELIPIAMDFGFEEEGAFAAIFLDGLVLNPCLLYTSPSPRDS